MGERVTRVVSRKPLNSIALYTGAGGLDIGLEQAGFKVCLSVEIDCASRETLRLNRPNWKQSEPGDMHLLSPATIVAQAGIRPGTLTLVSGGPPCQPFSKSSYWIRDTRRLKDERSKTLNAYLRFVDFAQPRVLLLENVKGFTYERKDEGIRLLKSGLARINRIRGTSYRPIVVHVNAADYGVPQLRERVFVIAERGGKAFSLPQPTHGPRSMSGAPYRTTWDAIGDLDIDVWPADLRATGAWADLLPSIPEGQNYLWHTPKGEGISLFGWRTRYWSFLLKLAKNQPAWTIQAQPGPATGPFHWRSRKLSIRELCRLQTFPDDYKIVGTYRESYRQVGNAVPPALGQLLGLEIRRQLLGERVRRVLTLIPHARGERPAAERPHAVPNKYLHLQAKHADHPGAGLGPGARSRAA